MAQINIDYDNCQSVWFRAVENKKASIVESMIDALYLFLQFQAWDALPDDSIMEDEIAYLLYGTMAYLTHSVLNEDFEQIRSRLHPMWRLPRNQKGTPDTLWLLPFVALICTKEGDLEQAVRYLGATMEHEMAFGFGKCLMTWTPFVDLQETLLRDLGEKTYDSLWQEGKSLDLPRIAQVLSNKSLHNI